jgi:glycerol-3-phosphate acyltransferase PlsY
MNLLFAVIAAIGGYLFGSISSARVVVRLTAAQPEVAPIAVEFPGSDIVFESDAVSASAVRFQLGARYGCLTAVLDMLKVAIPTLIVRLWQPDEAYYLVLAGAGVVGHAWPVYYRFKGGRGESPILGGLLVIDAPGLLVTTVMGWLLGWMTGNLLVLRWGFLGLMIPWFWFRTHDLPPVVYMVFVNAVYWIAMLPEIRQYFKFQGQDQAPTQEEMSRFWGMGGQVGRVLDRHSVPALLKHRRE